MARKLGSPSLSRLGVSRDLEIENNATITGLGLGLVAEVNLVELGLVMVYDGCICGLRLVVVYELGLVVVYGRGLVVVYVVDVYGLGLAADIW